MKGQDYRTIPFKTVFYQNRKGKLVGRVPKWWRNVHFDLMLVRFCFAHGQWQPPHGEFVKVQMVKRGVKGTVVWVKPYEEKP